MNKLGTHTQDHPVFEPAILRQHIGILGKTGSGKTSTAKLLVEQVVRSGARVCVLDPIKSDWWGLTSSADGTQPGLPMAILGGPKGDVPLHPSAGAAVGELVASGKLPLSIIDMADFGPGGLADFFLGFAPALLRHMTGVLYLVVEEAHEFAPKERAGLGNESMLIHWAKKLATAGRSKGLRIVVATQRVQSLHNAVLSSCDTLVVHRLTYPSDQTPVVKWIAANVGKASAAKVEAELSKLPTGTGWVCSGEAGIFDRRAFPRITTFDNSATPTGDAKAQAVTTASVDLAQLKSLLGASVEHAAAEDPKALRAKVRELTEQLRQAMNKPPEAPADIERQVAEATAELRARVKVLEKAVELAQGHNDAFSGLVAAQGDVLKVDRFMSEHLGASGVYLPTRRSPDPRPTAPDRTNGPSVAPSTASAAAAGSVGQLPEGLGVPHQKIVDAVRWWMAVGIESPSRVQVAHVAGYSPSGGSFKRYLSGLAAAGLIHYDGPGNMALTPGGWMMPSAVIVVKPSNSELHALVMAQLDAPGRKILGVLLGAQGREMGRTQLAEQAGYEPSGGTFKRYLSTLSGLHLITYPKRTTIAAAAWLFSAGGK